MDDLKEHVEAPFVAVAGVGRDGRDREREVCLTHALVPAVWDVSVLVTVKAAFFR